MENNDSWKMPSLTVRKINYVIGGLAILVSVLLLFIPGQVSAAYQHMLNVTEDYLAWRDVARNMPAASDYLTEQVHYFVVTGDRTYLDNYMEEVNVTKRREKALNILKREVKEKEIGDAWSQMSAAMQKSQELMNLEYRAFRLGAEGFGFRPEDLPDEVTNISLSESQEMMDAQEKIGEARNLVFSSQYYQEKNAISLDMEQCINSLLTNREERQTIAAQEVHTLLVRQKTLVCILACIVLMVIISTIFLIVEPLRKGALYIKEEKPFPVKGAGELRFLAQTYNRIYTANQDNRKQLAYDAKHDRLTNVLNRRGYDQLLEVANLRYCALLLVDVDKFKGINDTYGHKVGDKVLIKVARCLTEHFRAEDAICRIGGDEFAVLVTQVGTEYWPQIKDKITHINELLQNPTDGLPKVSISVGCAFGNSWKTTGALDKDADLALYQVKENGRCGCAYYN